MSDVPPPKAGPRLPDDSAPLSLEHTPAHFPVTAEYVKRKLAEQSTGKPVFSPKLVPWFFAGFTLFSAASAAVVGDPSIPSWVVKVAVIGATTFGGLLAASPGFRKGLPK